jgi:hypothetical protein
VLEDGFVSPSDRTVKLHSDRHHVLLAFVRSADGEATETDRTILREAAVADAHHTVALQRVVDELARRDIDSLVLKGAGISHAAYPEPYLRPRNDDDIWVRERDFEAACAGLAGAGYAPQLEVTSPEITRQRHFVARGARFDHEVDLHWWPVNPTAFDALPSFDECHRESIPLAAIGAHVRAPGPAHALLLACAHRVAHHTETEDAMWHCDLHFLAGVLSPADWAAFEELARRARVARITGVALHYVMTRLGTRVPPGLVERLQQVEGEAASRYLRPLGPLHDFWLEWRARAGVQRRLRLVTHHVLPPRAYVAARYGYDGVALLPFYYAHRVINGLAQWTAELMARRNRN